MEEPSFRAMPRGYSSRNKTHVGDSQVRDQEIEALSRGSQMAQRLESAGDGPVSTSLQANLPKRGSGNIWADKGIS